MNNSKSQSLRGRVGQEVIPAGKRVLDQPGELSSTRITPGAPTITFKHGRMAPENFLDVLRPADAIFLGAVGHPEVPDHVTLNGLLLPIRRGFDQFANVRPGLLYQGVHSPLALRKGEKIDMVVVRENTEGEYAQVGGFVYHAAARRSRDPDRGFTRRGIDRVIRFAFELARKRQEEARHLHHQIERAGLRHGAVGSRVSTRSPRNIRISRPNPCWWTRPP